MSIFKNNILCKFTIISSILVIISLDAQAQAKNKAKTDFVSDTVGIDNKEVIAADKVLTHKDSLQLISSDSIGKKKTKTRLGHMASRSEASFVVGHCATRSRSDI